MIDKELKNKLLQYIKILDSLKSIDSALPSNDIAVEVRANQKAIGILNNILNELGHDPKLVEENKLKDSFN